MIQNKLFFLEKEYEINILYFKITLKKSPLLISVWKKI